jgi:hypothetical protein
MIEGNVVVLQLALVDGRTEKNRGVEDCLFKLGIGELGIAYFG